MGLIRYKYSFERLPSLEEIVQCFGETTGLALSAEPLSAELADCRHWVLTAEPLRGDAEVDLDGNVLWVVPDAPRWIGSSYFLLALVQVLHRLGAQRPAPRIPRYASTRWADLPGWRKWLNR